MEAAGHRTGIVLLSITWQEICPLQRGQQATGKQLPSLRPHAIVVNPREGSLGFFVFFSIGRSRTSSPSPNPPVESPLSHRPPPTDPPFRRISSPVRVPVPGESPANDLPDPPVRISPLPSPSPQRPATSPPGGSPLPCGCLLPAPPFSCGSSLPAPPFSSTAPPTTPCQQRPVNNTPLRVNRKEIPETDIMNWKFPIFGGSQQQQPQPNFQETPTQSWYPSSVSSSPSRTSTPTNSSGTGHQRTYDRPQSPSQGQPSPAEAAGIIAHLKDKSVDELRKLLTDKEAYNSFFNSLDQVKIQNNVRDELRKVTLQLARENLEKEPQILELRNQCTIIRTTELAAAQEKLAELERIKDETLSRCSPSALLEKLHDGMAEADKESEELHRQLLVKEIDLATFVQNYKKLRTLYHRRALLHLAAKTSGLAA